MLKNKNFILLIIIVALALIGWGISRDNSLEEKESVPKINFTDSIHHFRGHV